MPTETKTESLASRTKEVSLAFTLCGALLTGAELGAVILMQKHFGDGLLVDWSEYALGLGAGILMTGIFLRDFFNPPTTKLWTGAVALLGIAAGAIGYTYVGVPDANHANRLIAAAAACPSDLGPEEQCTRQIGGYKIHVNTREMQPTCPTNLRAGEVCYPSKYGYGKYNLVH